MIAILANVPSQIDELLHQSGGGPEEDKIASVSSEARSSHGGCAPVALPRR